jgi:multiple sugar transport system permease protein
MSDARQRSALAFVVPSVVILVAIYVYPFLYAISQSLHDGTLLTTGNFVGTQNYGEVLTDGTFWAVVRFSVIFAALGVGGSYVLGLALSLMLRNIPGGAFFRVLLLLPWVAPVVVSMTSWDWLLGTTGGLVNSMLRVFGLGPVFFFATPSAAILTVCAVKIWATYPFAMLVMGAGLQGIDPALLEAAALDGAGSWQRFRDITFPLLWNVSIVSWILMAIFCVNDFATLWLLTGGGPLGSTRNLIVYAYELVFSEMQTGRGVVVAILAAGMVTVFSFLLFAALRKTGAPTRRARHAALQPTAFAEADSSEMGAVPA